MFKIIIEDKDLNESIHYKQNIDVDIFVERYLADSSDPDSLTITIEELDKVQINALRTLKESDWWVIRSVDEGDLTPVPEDVTDMRTIAREVL